MAVGLALLQTKKSSRSVQASSDVNARLSRCVIVPRFASIKYLSINHIPPSICVCLRACLHIHGRMRENACMPVCLCACV